MGADTVPRKRGKLNDATSREAYSQDYTSPPKAKVYTLSAPDGRGELEIALGRLMVEHE